MRLYCFHVSGAIQGFMDGLVTIWLQIGYRERARVPCCSVEEAAKNGREIKNLRKPARSISTKRLFARAEALTPSSIDCTSPISVKSTPLDFISSYCHLGAGFTFNPIEDLSDLSFLKILILPLNRSHHLPEKKAVGAASVRYYDHPVSFTVRSKLVIEGSKDQS